MAFFIGHLQIDDEDLDDLLAALRRRDCVDADRLLACWATSETQIDWSADRLNDATAEIVEAHPNVFDAETPKLGVGFGGLCPGRHFVELVQPLGGRIRIFLEEFKSVFETADLPRSVSTDGLLFSSFEPASKAAHQVDRLRSHGSSFPLDVQGAACG